VVLWSSLGSLLLCLLLFDLFLIADLLDSSGALEVPGRQFAEFELLTGEHLLDREADSVPFENRGILPAVWWSRDKFWGPALAAAYRRAAPLRENSSALMVLVLSAILISILRSLLLGRARTLTSRVASGAAMRLRKTLHRQTLRLGPSDLGEPESKTALGLFTRDVEQVREGVSQWVRRLGRSPFELLLLVIFALSIHWRVALQCLIPLAACWYVLQRERHRFDSARHLAAARADAELRLLGESFGKTRLVRGFGMEDFEQGQFQKHLQRYRDNVASLKQGERWSQWISRLLVMCCVSIVLYLLAIKVLLPPTESGALSFAAAIVLVTAFACMHRPLEGLWQLRLDRDLAAESADRIYRYLNQIPEVGQAVGAKFLQPLSKSLHFESVAYSLPNRKKLLDGFDLKLTAGEVVAFVSPDPLETRAMAYLLPRFIEPHSGRILIDGEDIAWVTLESLRAEVIYVGGSDSCFTGTVRENISCGNRRYSLTDVTEAAKQTHAHNFILKMPQGYDTVLGEHGEQLDPGESFRLALARAVLRKPALLIVEEPPTPIDDNTKALLDDAYSRIVRDRTVLFLPTRLSTLRRAGRIVLLHQGKIAGIGSHADLVKRVPLYRHWEYMHYNEFRHELESMA
jgi:ABC-type multidrug transport system fused ATPase/permease subunit